LFEKALAQFHELFEHRFQVQAKPVNWFPDSTSGPFFAYTVNVGMSVFFELPNIPNEDVINSTTPALYNPSLKDREANMSKFLMQELSSDELPVAP